MSDWDPQLYNRFRRYRAEPFDHVLSRLTLGPHERIVDLGCGSGENTIELARSSPAATALGIDSSPAMIDAANRLRATLEAPLAARVSFELGDLRNFAAIAQYSIVFSNAALQWVPNHRDVLAACYRALLPGGQLVVQMPANYNETHHLTVAALARDQPWRSLIRELPPDRELPPPDAYARILAELSFVAIECYYHTFVHPMASPAEVVEFYKSTGLRPYLNALPADRHASFLRELIARLETAYGTSGPLDFPFRRLFLWSRRTA